LEFLIITTKSYKIRSTFYFFPDLTQPRIIQGSF